MLCGSNSFAVLIVRMGRANPFFIIVMICINHASSNLQGGLVCSDWGICLRLRKTKLTISSETSHLVLCYNSQLKTEINCEKNTKYLHDASWHPNLPQFQGARPDHVLAGKFKLLFP